MQRIKKLVILAATGLGMLYAFFVVSRLSSTGKGNGIIHANGEEFIGSESCKKCHADIYNSFISTAHYLTSRPAEEKYIKGNFDEPRNEYIYNSQDKVKMQKTDSGFYQVGFSNNIKRGSQRFDIVVGSGTKGQTYLHWTGRKLVQLPVSYFVPDSTWSSSPGYPADRPLINRPITGQCLDCHSTYFKVQPKMGEADEFDPKQIMYGIGCERCHGPAARHVAYHTNCTEEKAGKFIFNAQLLNRRQQVDACAVCHASIRKSPYPPFSFQTGNVLVEEYMSFDRGDTTSQAEVHGNQFGLLALSKCYLKSDNMTCSSCHNTHQRERGNLALFSAKCLTCHSTGNGELCKASVHLGKALETNCIDCHMPINSSSKITLRGAGKKQLTPEKVRTHYIKVYPKQAAQIMLEMSKIPQASKITNSN